MEKLLFIDDDDTSRAIFQKAFQNKYTLFIANSAANAFAILEEEEIPVIISDQKMPNQTGLELFNILANRASSTPSIKILVTGYKELDTAIHAVNQGYIYKYITKPFEIEKLEGILEQAYQVYFSKINEKIIQQTIDQEREIRNGQYAHQLHENIAQNIASVNYSLSALKSKKNMSKEQLDNSYKLLQQTISSVRELSHEISPRLQEYGDLKLAIESLAWKEEIDINLKVQGKIVLEKKLEIHLFRLMQYIIKYWKTQKRTSISFVLYKSDNGKIQLLLYKEQQLEYSTDFIDSIKILIKPYGGIFSTQNLAQKNSNCITYPLF
jgi:CheY-like chemotaxis protein